ncbi:hypothetical protein BDZ97DRAFT_1796566 [Flammula alnicola]|nr:hypothetical protein BDZ97DRAFT_1796566 [Flammula alnicola]
MHRHCLRSALSHYTEAAGKNCLQTVHRTFFSSSSSSSSILTSTPDSVARTIPSNDHKARKYKGKKKIPIARKRVHRNPGTAESVPKPIVPKAPKPNVPTPPRGISVAKALRSQLLKEEARTYVDDKKTEMAEEIEMDDEGAERREFTPGTFVELRMCAVPTCLSYSFFHTLACQCRLSFAIIFI